MIHLGDITAISGYTVPPVDAVIGGSPCQDLSAAGKRAGLAGERSSLFMEQIRIIKEMREADVRRGHTGKFIRPRFMVWENVPGAFSSNKGEDFRAVLEETIRVAEPDAPDVPLPPKGKWPLADCWFGDGWSVAYRVLDAQFWGVPQRRRRIALVADFGGHAAPEILFIRQSVCGDIAAGGAAREEIAAGAGSGTAGTAWCLQGNAVDREAKMNGLGISEEPMFTLNTIDRHAICAGFKPHAGANAGSIGYAEEKAPMIDTGKPMAVFRSGTDYLTGWDNQEKRVFSTKGVSPTLSGSDGGGGRTVCGYIYDARGNGDGKTACTLTGDHQSRVTDYTAIVMSTGQAGAEVTRDIAPTMNCNHEQPIVMGVDCRNGTESQDVVAILQAHNNGGFSLNCTHPVRIGGQVRRLTPLECERLQGYPDGWTDIGAWTDSTGKLHKESSDSARYKALGNSIALPPWSWVLKRLCACYEREATMASLFDGIGGFPLIWERLNGPGACLWASEIEEFPIAVTRRRFGGEKEVGK